MCFGLMLTASLKNTYVFKMCFFFVVFCVSLFSPKLHNTYVFCCFAPIDK